MATENNNVKVLNIEDFEQSEEFVNYVGNGLLITDRIELAPFADERVRINFFLIVICKEGRFQLEINGKAYQIETGNTLTCLPTMILCHGMHSPGAQVQMIGFSNDFIRRTVKQSIDMQKTFSYLFQNPIRHDLGTSHSTILSYYGGLISEKLKDNGQRFRNEILEYIFSALIYEILSDIFTCIGHQQEEDTRTSSRRVFGRFIEALSADGGRHRSLAYYADLLCYSPKYVSAVVKQTSGRTALDWINEYTMQHIKYELKHSNQSIKEIAEMFDFPNQSFFGKYVKAHLGMSPARYRNNEE